MEAQCNKEGDQTDTGNVNKKIIKREDSSFGDRYFK